MKPPKLTFVQFELMLLGLVSWLTFGAFAILTGNSIGVFAFIVLSVLPLEQLGWTFLLVAIDRKVHFTRATNEELQKEDDVLLQGTAFTTAIFFFYLNTLLEKNPFESLRIPLSVALVIFAGIFFCYRAFAKIKSSRIYRFISVFMIIGLVSQFVFELLIFLFPLFFPSILNISPFIYAVAIIALILSPIPESLFAVTLVYFCRRYGIKFVKKGRYYRMEVESDFVQNIDLTKCMDY